MSLDEMLRRVEEAKKVSGVPVIPEAKTNNALWVDVREVRLRYTISIDRIKEFFDALSEGKILATKCKSCGQLYFPPQADCSKCRKGDMKWVDLPREGKLITYTMINVKPSSFAHYEDYIVGIAELENGIKVLAWVREKDPKKLRVGQRVKLEVVRRQPENYFVYEIVPIRE